VVVAAERFLRQLLRVRQLREIQLLVESVGDVEAADVRRRERDVDERRPFRDARFREPVERAADFELHRNAGLRRERLGDDPLDRVLPVPAPHADDERALGE
jgi:hypothetical protein